MNPKATERSLAAVAAQVTDDLYNDATGAELAARTRLERLAAAPLLALQAIYHELRHGHDRVARHTTALDDLVATISRLPGALQAHAGALGALEDHPDALRRYRSRY
jgi:hypothetical protein